MSQPSPPWITDDIRAEMNDRDALQKRLKNNRLSVGLQNEFKQKKKRVKSLLHSAKSSYFRNQLNSCRSDVKETWKTIKKIIPNSSQANFKFDKSERQSK